MTSEREGGDVGAGRMTHAICLSFEWMSFSGLMRLGGAEDVLPAGTSFFGALLSDAERGRVRAALEAAALRGGPLSLTCGLATTTGPRTFLLEGEVVRGERAMAPRVVGVLVEQPDGPARPEAGLTGVMRLLAGALGEREEGVGALGAGAEGAGEVDA